MPDFRFKTAKKLLDHVLEGLAYFQPEGKTPPAIPYHRVDGDEPLVVMLGDNASGKSFARRCVQSVAHMAKVETIHVSMEGRAGPDYTGGIRTFIYGDESYRSTGENSASTVLGGIRTCRGRDKAHVMFWDEPDLGLSDSWAAGAGVAIRKFAEDPPKHTLAAFVITHSRPLVKQLLDVNPTYIYFGDDEAPKSLSDWLKRPIVPKDIEQLGERSRVRFKRIQKILDDVKRKKEASK